jgi:hypothetical protein
VDSKAVCLLVCVITQNLLLLLLYSWLLCIAPNVNRWWLTVCCSLLLGLALCLCPPLNCSLLGSCLPGSLCCCCNALPLSCFCLCPLLSHQGCCHIAALLACLAGRWLRGLGGLLLLLLLLLC